MASAVTQHAVFRARDMDAANAALHRVRSTFAMLRHDRREPLQYHHEAYAIPGLRLSHVGVHGSVVADIGDEDAVTVAWMSSGRTRYDYRNAGGDHSDRIVLGPGPGLPNNPGSLTAAVKDATLEIVTIDRKRIEDAGRTVYGDDGFQVRFDSPRPVTPQLATFWTQAQQLAWTLMAEGAAEHPLVRASLFRSMAIATLESFPLLGDREQRVWSALAQADAYRRASRFLEDHASLPITVDDAAQAAGVPTRTLVHAFRAHSPSGMTPTEYLRRVRLDAARSDLTARRGSTVREIGMRWGFADPAVFSRAYKAEYGETPGATFSR